MDWNQAQSKISRLSVAVVGDLCLDAYYFLQEKSGPLSIETGKGTRVVERQTFDGGGAANVALNFKALGVGRVDLYGVVGDDGYALVLDQVLKRAGVSNRALTQNTQWATYVYNKFYSGGVEEPRVDIGNFNTPHEATVEALLSAFQAELSSYDLVVLNQQVRESYQTQPFQKEINRLIAQTKGKTLWFCDCRDLNDVYRSAIHKLNREEGLVIFRNQNPGAGGEGLSERELVTWLHGHWGQPVVLTKGENGAAMIDDKEWGEVPGIHVIHQVDTVGAGDAFLAGFASAFTAAVPSLEALNLGNAAASVAVQKLFQTGHPRWQEVAFALDSPDYRYRPESAENPLAARYLPGTPIEVLSADGAPRPQIAIFDHDGTISTLRLGWESVMESMMVRSVAGGGALSAKHLEQVTAAVQGLITRTTGVQTLVQMQALVRLIGDFGLVKSTCILDPKEYKDLFNRELLASIASRAERVKSGRLSVADVTIKGSVEFLHRLAAAGTTLYLASGTDVADVIAEATLLGYADLFQGRIFGSVGNLDKDPKRLVFEKIFGEVSQTHGQRAACVVFGDGPVELREGKKFGATAIGLVSDERQRFGINPAKRERLVLAGADVLIPDFSWDKELIEHLGWTL